MCEPSLIVGGISAGMSLAQGFAAKSAADQNASNMRMQGRQQLAAASNEANMSRAAAGRELGRQRAIQAASGLDLSSGTPADVGGESAKNLEMDALMKMYKGRLGNWQSGVAADQQSYSGKQALMGSMATATGSLLGGAAKGGMFDDWFKSAKPTDFDGSAFVY